MAIRPREVTVKAPEGGHLALGTATGQKVAIPAGAELWIVEDPTRADSIFPMYLKSVSHKKIVFVMQDSEGGITEYTYKLTAGKPRNAQALQRMAKNRGGVV